MCTSSGKGYKLMTATVYMQSSNNSFPVGPGETAHHAASLMLAPQCRAFTTTVSMRTLSVQLEHSGKVQMITNYYVILTHSWSVFSAWRYTATIT